MFNKFKVLQLPDLLKLQELKTYFKCVHSELPSYLLELPLDLNVNIHNDNTRGHTKIHANAVIHEFAKRCLRYNNIIIKTVNNSPFSVNAEWLSGRMPDSRAREHHHESSYGLHSGAVDGDHNNTQLSVAYPELVLRGVSERRKCKWPVRVGASNGVTPLIKTNHGRGGGGFPGNQKTTLDTPLIIEPVTL